MAKDKKLVTGHDFATHAHFHGAKKVHTWGGPGPNNYYHVEGPNKESVVFPANKLSKGTRFNLLNAFLKLGLMCVLGGLPVLYLVAEAASRGLIK